MSPLLALIRRYVSDEPYRRLPANDLWARFRDHRDEAAFRVLLDQLGPKVFARCRAVLRNDALAEEVFQSAFVELIRSRSRIPGYGAAVGWVLATATNLAKDAVRRNRRSAARDRARATPEAVPTDDALLRQEDHDAVHAALADLPTRERQALEVVYLEGMTHSDAAAALGWSRGSVGKYVQRGLERLRVKLGSVAGGMAATEAALRATPPPLPTLRQDALFAAMWASADALPALASGWWVLVRTATAAALGLCATAATVGWFATGEPTTGPSPPVVPTAIAEESLQARNLRLFHADILPRLLVILRESVPAGYEVQVVDAQAIGSAVECEFTLDKPLPTYSRPPRFHGTYCLHQRRLDIRIDHAGDGTWAWVDPRAPTKIDPMEFGLPLPRFHIGAGRVADVMTAFGRLPVDARSESELVRHLFGPPTGVLVLPNQINAITGDATRMFVRAEAGLYQRMGGGWRYRGECPYWFLTHAEGRLYGDRDGIWVRDATTAGAEWKPWCARPPEDWRRFQATGMTIAAGRLYFLVQGDDAQGFLWSRRLSDPQATWERAKFPLHPRQIAAADGWLFGVSPASDALFRRAADDPAAAWEQVEAWPTDTAVIQSVSDTVLAVNHRGGPIYARRAGAAPNTGWQIMGSVRAPEDLQP